MFLIANMIPLHNVLNLWHILDGNMCACNIMTCHRVGVPCCEDLTEVLNENKTLQTPTKEGGGEGQPTRGPLQSRWC